MPKEGDFISCPNPNCIGQATWVCLGEPEGDFYSCEKCNGEFDADWKDLNDDSSLSDKIHGLDNELVDVDDLQRSIGRLIRRYKSICKIENLDTKWVLNPIYEEFGQRLTEGTRNG